ncbi:MAG: carbamoyltransferase [Candidatus Omnitrophota bacterium]
MIILGLNAYHPDSSACIIRDGILIAAVEEERFLRIKHWAGFPQQAIAYCLREAGIDLKDVDYVTLNRDPRANLHKKAAFLFLNHPPIAFIKSRLANAGKIRGVKEALGVAFEVPSEKIRAKIYPVEHHRAHLASTFFLSPFEDAAVVSIDGYGDFTSCMVARGVKNRLRELYEVNYPHSLGIFYTMFTQLLGFKNVGDEYKVMGLAAYGKPQYADKMEEILIRKPGGRFALDRSYIAGYKRTDEMLWNITAPVLEDVYSQKLVERFGPSRKSDEQIGAYHCDIAASVQEAYERAFFHILNHAHEVTQTSRLCLAGGCALNSLANGKIFDRTPFKEVYIQPASSDAGGSLGSAYYLYHQVLGHARTFVMDTVAWGPGYSRDQIGMMLEEKKDELTAAGCHIEMLENDDQVCARTARAIADGNVVGWFQGRMEWGPRALGYRSILVDPRRKEMKDILNARIKRREWFRPFAPSVLLERVGDYFEKEYPDPFMIKVYQVKKDKRETIPAVTHVDGTGRLQTVSRADNPLYWKLIKEFEAITGVPVLLNTSFNENEPIVNTPQEALECFLRTKMDCIALGPYLVHKGKK